MAKKTVKENADNQFEHEPVTSTDVARLRVRKIGNSHGVILPKEVLAHLGVGEGDELDWCTTKDGGIELRVLDRQVDDLMALAEDIMSENRAVLRALAK